MVLCSAVLLVSGLTSCSGGTTSTGPGKTGTASTGQAKTQSGKIKIGAVMYARDIEFWQLIEAGMKAAATKEGASIDVQVSNRNLATEAQVVSTFRSKGDNVLVISPYDASASIATLKQAASANMTVVQYNTQVTDTSFKYFVGVDNQTLGAAAGKALVDYVDSKLGGKANLAILNGDTEPGGVLRKKGFESALAGHDGIKIVTSVTAVGSPVAGTDGLNTSLQAHPETNVVWAWNGASLQGAAVAAKNHTNVQVFGVDMSTQVANIMTSPASSVVAVADQHAYNVGYQAVETAVQVAQGKQVTSTNDLLQPVVYESSDPASIQNFLQELKK